MANVVLYEEDVAYFLYNNFDTKANVEQTTSRLHHLVSEDTAIGRWLAENRIVPKFTSLNSPKTSSYKYVIYANLSEVQQTEYTLKFSYT